MPTQVDLDQEDKPRASRPLKLAVSVFLDVQRIEGGVDAKEVSPTFYTTESRAICRCGFRRSKCGLFASKYLIRSQSCELIGSIFNRLATNRRRKPVSGSSR